MKSALSAGWRETSPKETPADLDSLPETALNAFRSKVVKSAALFQQLQTVGDHRSFIILMTELGAAHGYIFSPEDVRGALRWEQRRWFERNVP